MFCSAEEIHGAAKYFTVSPAAGGQDGRLLTIKPPDGTHPVRYALILVRFRRKTVQEDFHGRLDEAAPSHGAEPDDVVVDG